MPSADIIPPTSGIPESEKRLPPLPDIAPADANDWPLDDCHHNGKYGAAPVVVVRPSRTS